VCSRCAHAGCTITSESWTSEQAIAVKDSNGTVLSAGDSVTVIKDLKVRGASIPLKRGTVIKNIRLVEDDDEHVEGNSDKIKGLVLKACFLKKV
jgi:protein PhnA